MTKMHTPEYLAYRDGLGLQPWQKVKPGDVEPAESGWTWNHSKTKAIPVEGVKIARFFNFDGDRLEGKGRNSFCLKEFWATEQEATAALIAHHEAQVAKLKKQVASTEKKIAKLRNRA